jgi:hypothetical protein
VLYVSLSIIHTVSMLLRLVLYVDRYADFVLTKDLYHEVTDVSPMFALDCEMCRTTSGELEVTRVSVVNEQLEVSATFLQTQITKNFMSFHSHTLCRMNISLVNETF